MRAAFTFLECAHCGETQAVLADGRMAIHFTRDGDRCSGSDRDPGADPSREQAEGVDASLQQALDRLGGRRAS